MQLQKSSRRGKPEPQSELPEPVLCDPRILEQVLRQPKWSYFDPHSHLSHKTAAQSQALALADSAKAQAPLANAAQACEVCAQLRRLSAPHDLRSIARLKKWDNTVYRIVKRLLVETNAAAQRIQSPQSCAHCFCLSKMWQPRRVQTMVELERWSAVHQATIAEWLRALRSISRQDA